MTNKEIISNWRNLKIKFRSKKESIPLLEMFLVCAGETEIDIKGEKEIVVIFYQGYDDKGSLTAFFTSDGKNTCWTYGFDSKNKTHIKSKIGKFIKNK